MNPNLRAIMAKVTFITESGEEVAVNSSDGTLMEIARENEIDGIDGDCGGVGSCSTCHVRVRADWLERVGKADGLELDTLEFEDGTDERSRLCCQIEMSDELNGLVVEVAKL